MNIHFADSYTYSELSQKTGFFKEQNAGFSAQIHRVTLTKTWLRKKACYYLYMNLIYQQMVT